jgi:NTE family protein
VSSHLHPRFRFAERPPLGPGIGLALGAGFARGLAHLGVLSVFEEEHIPISCIVGSGVGALLGAAYAAGTPLGRIIGNCRELRFRDFARWRISRPRLCSSKRLDALVDRWFDSLQFETLAIPLGVAATDLGTGDPVIFKEGLLSPAIRASCAFPGLFEPVQIGTRYLADGALVAPVPTRAASEFGAESVVGVFLGLQDGERGAPTNMFQVVSRALSAMQKTNFETWGRHANLVLYPSVQSVAWNAFERIDEVIEAGAEAARKALPQIRKLATLQAEVTPESSEQTLSLLKGAPA